MHGSAPTTGCRTGFRLTRLERRASCGLSGPLRVWEFRYVWLGFLDASGIVALAGWLLSVAVTVLRDEMC